MPADSALSLPSSPVATVGTISLIIAYLVAGWAVAAGIAGNVRKNQRLILSSVYGLYAFSALAALASALIIYAFMTHDFSIKYVAATSDISMPVWYKLTAFWGGLDGSLLFWVLVLGLFSTVAVRANQKRHRDMIGFVVATIMVVQLFFLSLLLFHKNPFSTYLVNPPADGQGLNPLLQNYWMVIHPPSLYIGFVAATIPFAFGIAALASGRLNDVWLGSVRVWMMICFFFLSFGLILGGRWAYEELGWGGYWAWDPVENAGFIPWFTSTAFLHSAIVQEQRGSMKRWNLTLVILTFFLTIFGTFMTRSGVVQSVHAFGEDSVLALQFVVFMAVILIVSFGLLVFRSNRLAKALEFDSFLSRDFAFLLNNWILLACAGFVLFATMFPTISEAVDGSRVSVGPAFFNKWMTPLGLVLVLLGGIAPLLAWRKTTRERLYNQFLFPVAVSTVSVVALAVLWPATRVLTPVFADTVELPMVLVTLATIIFAAGSIAQEFWRGVGVRRRQTGSDPVTSLIGLVLSKRRKYGGYVIHLGIAVMFLGFAGKAYEQMRDRTIEHPGVAATDGSFRGGSWFDVGGYDFFYEKLITDSNDNRTAVFAQVSVYKDGKQLTTEFPAKFSYRRSEQPTTEVAIHPRLAEDVYLVLTGYDTDTGVANFRIYINPLINFVWFGFVLLALGTLICLIPQRVVEMLSPRRALGLAEPPIWAVVLLAAGGVTFGLAQQALAADAPVQLAQAGGEHAGPGMGTDGTGFAHLDRPQTPVAEKLMRELVCLCGGCKREDIYSCKCGYAAQERQKVNQMLLGKDLSTEAGQKQAYDEVVKAFVANYGGEHVLNTPTSSVSWILPSLAAVGGLGLLLGVGYGWVRKGQSTVRADERQAQHHRSGVRGPPRR
ncbi:MAG: cytochrome c biogenesis protein CcsA [Myxococcales bacterium]|nr:cytochrome c biogenesis protein CcsA [Myxococcales bacterium]